MYKTFSDMYNTMYVITKFISRETNLHWALLMGNHTTYDTMKSDEYVQLNWESYMVHIRTEDSDLDETLCTKWDDVPIFSDHRL